MIYLLTLIIGIILGIPLGIYLVNKPKEDLIPKIDIIDESSEEFVNFTKKHINTLADKHPVLIIRGLAKLLRIEWDNKEVNND